MKAKSSSQMCYFWHFFNPMFVNCFQPETMFVHVSECENFFPLNYTKFVVECDWNSKNSRNAQKNFGKTHGFFRKKTLKFFKIATCGNFFLERLSNGIFS